MVKTMCLLRLNILYQPNVVLCLVRAKAESRPCLLKARNNWQHSPSPNVTQNGISLR